ncbi:hypothetical protein RvY_10145 [Ramazzottius varieornatus]|uniref:Uncharacterized protein n=1 Tax=Ramazzottius varieornatus TaxID=947166 RepID=A0A1D1VBS9_RAMVA|nr:hypothetical protein RvY_10145 [Ramazzottius varieornatus]
MGDQTDEAKDLSPTEIKPPAKTPQSKLGKRQASVQVQPTHTENQLGRRNSQPMAAVSARPRLQNGLSKNQGKPSSRPATSAASARPSDASRGTSSTRPRDGSAAPERKPKPSLPKASRREQLNNRPELGKGRLERGKQVSHLGLFPLSGQIQRQSTSMNVEAGSVDADHAAEMEETSLTTAQVGKSSGSWKKQIDHLAKSLTEYAENHPQFSSQLSSCRLDKVLGLRTVKTLKGDQLTLNVTFSISPALFDVRSRSAKEKSLANIRHRSAERSDELTDNPSSNRVLEKNRGPDVRISADDEVKETDTTEKRRKASAGNTVEPDSSVPGGKTEENDFSK